MLLRGSPTHLAACVCVHTRTIIQGRNPTQLIKVSALFATCTLMSVTSLATQPYFSHFVS